ncbi:MAG: PAS domain S-box protein, partial [Chthoniobacteraceae bacterium]|nr:PAS domain S-box protein [Chthoniobacteraceae bacterium]
MSEPSDPNQEKNALRDQIIGLGSRSVRKSYYPQLQQQIDELEKARQQAEENERKFRALFEEITDGVVVGDPETRLVKKVNPAFCKMLGYTEEELLRLTVFDIHPPEEIPRLLAEIAKQKRGQSILIKDLPFKRKDGSIVYTDVNGTAIDIDNRLCILGVCRDITERKQAEEALREREEWMRYIIQHDPNAITVLDNDLRLRFVSDRFLKDYNIAEFDVIGRPFYDVVPEMPERWKAVHRRCLAGSVEKSDDDSFERSDGSITYNRWECRPWYLANGKIGGIIIYTEVVTERKLAEQRLQRSEADLGRAQAIAHLGSWSWDIATNRISWSEEMFRVFGVEPETFEVTMAAAIRRTHPEDLGKQARFIKELLAGKPTEAFEYRIIRPDGTERVVEVNGVQIEVDAEGRPQTIFGTTQDITERKQAEQAVIRSEQKYRELVENANSIILRWTPEGIISYLNEFGLTFFGYTEEEIRGRSLAGTIVPEQETTGRNLFPLMSEIRGNPKKYEHNINENIRRNGERVWIAWTNKVVLDNEGQIKEILSIGSDITERIRTEEALDREQEFNRALVENMVDAVVACNADFELTLFNRAARECHGVDATKIPPDQWAEYYHLFRADGVTPMSLDEVPLARAFRGETLQNEPMVIRAMDQPPRYLLANSAPFFDEKGRKLGAVAVMHDITKSKQVEEALKREQVFNNAVLNSVPGLLYLYNEQGNLIRWNKQHEVLTGYSAEELSQMHVLDWFAGNDEDAAVVANGVKQCFAEGYAEIDASLRTKSGAKILFHLTGVSLEIDGKNYLAGIGVDITERKRAEEELHRLNRLYSVLSQVNMAVIHAGSRRELLERICKVSVEVGAFKMAWVGEIDPETHQVVPVATAGDSGGYLRKVKVYADDRPEGRGPIGTSIREGRPYVCNDFHKDPCTLPWRDTATIVGFNAIISLPLSNRGKVFGAFSVYAGELDCFHAKEVELLEEVASDVSFALDHLDQERRRQQDELVLKQAKETAEAANRAKDQFIAVLSHELRTPLTPVLTTVALLQAQEEMSDELKTGMDIIHRNVELEARLIDDLLDVTRISRGIVELHREVVDVHACLLKTLEICRSEIAKKDMEVSLSLRAKEYHVWADSARLQQVFWNLLKNAVKFTPEEGRISIRSANADGWLKIEVADSGIGIEPEALPRIFNAFEQGEKT